MKRILFWSALAIGAVILGASLSYCIIVSPPRGTTAEERPIDRLETDRQTTGRRSSSAVTLAVHVLPTDDGGGNGVGLYTQKPSGWKRPGLLHARLRLMARRIVCGSGQDAGQDPLLSVVMALQS